eukprot:SAG11_NODE_9789_length_880_cov_1.402049_1_plen_58_part_00
MSIVSPIVVSLTSLPVSSDLVDLGVIISDHLIIIGFYALLHSRVGCHNLTPLKWRME